MNPTNSPSAALPVAGRRFLVVGGASLVGSASAELLLREGAEEVVILDNFSEGSHAAIQHLAGERRLKTLTGDVLSLPQLLGATRGVDGVLQLAAVMTIGMHRDPWRGLDVNIRGTQNVLEACVVNRVKKVVFASSTAVYGYGPAIVGDLTEATPFHFQGAPAAAVLYGATKIIGEQLLRDAFQRRGLDYVALRYGTVYGERQHYRAANALYIVETHDRLRRGERPQVVGDGSEVKHFVHVSDVAAANAAAFAADATDVAVNISGPQPVTTRELIRLVTELTGSNVDPEFIEPDPGKVRLTSGGPWQLDHAMAARVIGWRPRVEMREGIARLLAWREQAQR